MTKSTDNKDYSPMYVRVESDLAKRVSTVCKEKGMTKNAFVVDAMNHYLRYLEGTYDVPNLTIQRLNQLIEMQTVVVGRMDKLEDTTRTGFQSFMELAHGSNYL